MIDRYVLTACSLIQQYVECARIGNGLPDRPGSLTLTGQVGEVLEESARIALSWIRSHAFELGLEASMPPIHLGPRASVEVIVDEDGTAEHLVPRPGMFDSSVNKASYGGPRQDLRRDSVCVANGPNMHQRPPVGLTASAPSYSSLGFLSPDGLGSLRQEMCVDDVMAMRQSLASSTSLSLGPIPPHERFGSANVGMGSKERRDRSGTSERRSPAVNWDIHIHLPAGRLSSRPCPVFFLMTQTFPPDSPLSLPTLLVGLTSHVPMHSGAIPKDGPSAGITLACVLVSLLSGRQVIGAERSSESA